jgi:hypothetical protein
MQSGAKQVEHCQEVWVAVDETDLEALCQLIRRYCGLLGQEVMYFEVTEAAVEFLTPRNGEGQTHDQSS